MSTRKIDPVPDTEKLQSEWIDRLSDLVTDVDRWCKELGWSTRHITKQMEESQIGRYQAPALLMQEETTKVLLEPVARFATGADGVVDLYLLPGYDDIASLYFYEGHWHLHYMFSGTPAVATIRDADSKLLSKKSLQEVLEEMKQNAA